MKRSRFFFLVSAILWVACFTSIVQAQGNSISIDGVVINGTTSRVIDDGLVVVFHEENSNTHRHLETVTDIEGKFEFEGIVFDPSFAYGISVKYQDGLYGSDLNLSDDMSHLDVSLIVYEATGNDEIISVDSSSMLFADVDKSSQSISVFEIVRMRNESDYAYVPGPEPMDLIRFALPLNASDLRVDTQLIGADVIQVDKGFALVATVPPGYHQVMFSYQLPYSHTETVIDKRFTYGAELVRVLAPEGVMELLSDILNSPEIISVGGVPYQVIQGVDLPRGTSITLTLSQLSKMSIQDNVNQRLRMVRFEYIAPIALSMLMSFLIFYGLKTKTTYSFRSKHEIEESPGDCESNVQR